MAESPPSPPTATLTRRSRPRPAPSSRGSPRGRRSTGSSPLLFPDPRRDRGARGLRLRDRRPGAWPRGGVGDALPCLALSPPPHPGARPPPGALRRVGQEGPRPRPQGHHVPHDRLPRAAELAVSLLPLPPARRPRLRPHRRVRASAYGLDDAYLARCEDELLIAVQVESAPAVARDRVHRRVDGVDVMLIGPRDLSASMGYLWDPSNRKVREAVKDAERRVFAVRKNNGGGGPYLGGMATPHDGAEQLKLRGYHMVVGAVDVGCSRSAAVEDVRRFRSAVAEIGEVDDSDDKPKDEEYWSE
uniref:HpcH/HpaI aldolase/citrate lyase domain-containing protein n=1 Tax=Ananas comosus var. bracteatus TaxID=296719 RepID=A0A6V7NS79_ANACO|nr:unnamed protein product [Ananas comosus var. bracteatus]